MAERYTVSTPSLFDDMPQSTRLVRGGATNLSLAADALFAFEDSISIL